MAFAGLSTGNSQLLLPSLADETSAIGPVIAFVIIGFIINGIFFSHCFSVLQLQFALPNVRQKLTPIAIYYSIQILSIC